MSAFTRIGALAALVLAAACGGDDGPSTPGYDLVGTGDLEVTHSGDAWFGVSEDPEETGFAFLFDDTQNRGTVLLVQPGATAVPAKGTYAIGDLEDGAADPAKFYGTLTTLSNLGLDGLFATKGGTLRITKVSGSRVEGVIAMQVVGATVEEPETVLELDVDVSFTAALAPDGTMNPAEVRSQLAIRPAAH